RDNISGELQTNTGGLLLAAVPGVSVNAYQNLWLHLRAQIPFVTHLFGIQRFGPQVTLSIQYSFASSADDDQPRPSGAPHGNSPRALQQGEGPIGGRGKVAGHGCACAPAAPQPAPRPLREPRRRRALGSAVVPGRAPDSGACRFTPGPQQLGASKLPFPPPG